MKRKQIYVSCDEEMKTWLDLQKEMQQVGAEGTIIQQCIRKCMQNDFASREEFNVLMQELSDIKLTIKKTLNFLIKKEMGIDIEELFKN
jgi:hypothetical protein